METIETRDNIIHVIGKIEVDRNIFHVLYIIYIIIDPVQITP